MNILNLIRKPIQVPATNEVKTIDAVQVWTVRWLSRSGPYSGDLRQEVEAFTSEDEAKAFKEALENAYKLLKHTSGTTVTLTKEA